MLRRLSTSPFVTNWMVVTVAASIVAALDARFAAWCALIPSRIVNWEVWRLFTWPLIEPGPLSLLVTCAVIYKFGGELAERWGDERLRRFITEVLIAAAVITCLLALVSGNRFMIRFGGWAVADALVIAWARQFPDRVLVLYGLVTLQGQKLIMVTIASAVIFAVFVSPVVMAPELAACALAAVYPRERLTRRGR